MREQSFADYLMVRLGSETSSSPPFVGRCCARALPRPQSQPMWRGYVIQQLRNVVTGRRGSLAIDGQIGERGADKTVSKPELATVYILYSRH
jgi:hypothetical protein